MSPQREPRFWNRENAPLIGLLAGLIIVMIVAGVVLLLINGSPIISRLTGS